MNWPTSAKEIEPFDEVKDFGSGFTGKVVSMYCYANGCCRFEVAGVDKDNQPVSITFDEEQLELVKRHRHMEEITRTGGARGSTPVAR